MLECALSVLRSPRDESLPGYYSPRRKEDLHAADQSPSVTVRDAQQLIIVRSIGRGGDVLIA